MATVTFLLARNPTAVDSPLSVSVYAGGCERLCAGRSGGDVEMRRFELLDSS